MTAAPYPTYPTRRRWFTTATFTHLTFVEGEPVRLPASLAHAKEAGTSTTACGVAAGTWNKLWDVAFPPPKGEACRTCLRIVADPRW